MNLLLSLYDRTGNWSQPYREADWEVIQIDIQNGHDIFKWDYRNIDKRLYNKIVVLAAVECTCYALCGNKHKKIRLANGEFEAAQKLVAKTGDIIDFFRPYAWCIENPKTDIHKKNGWIGQRPKFVFNPCDFANWHPVDYNQDRYNKETWLFGKFNDPIMQRMEPLGKEYPGFTNLGGKSLKTKNERSITPLGFAYAFYEANH